MKNLAKLMRFDSQTFFSNKDIRVVGDEPWYEYGADSSTKTEKGTKYKCIIAQDKTVYSEDTIGGNDGEALVIKVEGRVKPYSKFSIIKVIDPECKVYGEYRNQLSVVAKDIAVEARNENKKI
jgi:hypothetical protein